MDHVCSCSSTATLLLSLWATASIVALALAYRKMNCDAERILALQGQARRIMGGETADKTTQSQCTYTFVRGVRSPSFQVLPEYSQG